MHVCEVVLTPSNLNATNRLLEDKVLYVVSKQCFVDVPAPLPIRKGTLISSSANPVERPWTLRNQLNRLTRDGFRDKHFERINVIDSGHLADLKSLYSHQHIQVSFDRNDIATTISSHGASAWDYRSWGHMPYGVTTFECKIFEEPVEFTGGDGVKRSYAGFKIQNDSK